jgi:hypothetical protein
LYKYQKFLHISDDNLNSIKNIILHKFQNIQIYILNPSLNDLFNNNIYKLQIDNQTYFVPLWHNELYFDKINNDSNLNERKQTIIVKCHPKLPDNVFIDENNDIHIDLHFSFNFSLLLQDFISFKLGNNHFDIPINQLKIKTFQTYLFKNKGISQIQ